MRSLKPRDMVSIAKTQKQRPGYRQSNKSNTVGPPTRKATYPLLNKISNVSQLSALQGFAALTKRCAQNYGYRHISVVLTMSEQDMEHHHDLFYYYSWLRPVVKRWRGKVRLTPQRQCYPRFIYEVVSQRRPTIRLVPVTRYLTVTLQWND